MEALQEQKRIVLAQISGRMGDKAAQPSPPETFGAYAKKSGENPGVIAMIDLLIKDLAKEMTKAENEEKKSQADHDCMMRKSAEKRTLDSKSLTYKSALKEVWQAHMSYFI